MEEDVEEHEPDYVIGHSQFQQSLNQSVVIHFLQKKRYNLELTLSKLLQKMSPLSLISTKLIVNAGVDLFCFHYKCISQPRMFELSASQEIVDLKEIFEEIVVLHFD